MTTKTFDAVKMTREIRDKLTLEMAGMTPEASRRFVRERAEGSSTWKRLFGPADASVPPVDLATTSGPKDDLAAFPRQDSTAVAKKKAFDCVAMTREIRDQVSREMENMTSEERIQYAHGRTEASSMAKTFARPEGGALPPVDPSAGAKPPI